MRQRLRVARNWLASKDRMAVLALRIRRSLSVEKPLRIEGSKLRFTAESWAELDRSQQVVESWTADWMRALPAGSVLYDIGANIGVFSLLAAENPNVERVVAIEPAYFNYASLMRNAILNGLTDKVVALPIGLGETSGPLRFNLKSLRSGAAMHAFGDIFAFDRQPAEPAASYTCLCYRLDDLVALPDMPFPTHIKIDIDGHEADVLRGADAVLRDARVKGLQIEVMDHDPHAPRQAETVAFLAERGWQLGETIRHKATELAIVDLRFERAG